MMNSFIRWLAGIMSLILMFSFTAAYASAGEDLLVLKDTSVLTIDRKDSGYLKGIWGEITADELISQFEVSVEIFSPDGLTVEGKTHVSSDDIVRCGDDSVPVIIYGDVNRDGTLNLLDSVMMLRYFAKWEDVDICAAAADLDSDGGLDSNDVSVLLRFIAGWDVTLGDSVIPPAELELDDGYSIVVPSNADEFELEAAELVSEAIDSIYGNGAAEIITDDKSAAREILIGATSRTRTEEVSKDIGEFDWVYSVPSYRSIVIVGGDSIGTYEASQAFLWDNLGYVNKFNRMGSYTMWNGSEYEQIEVPASVMAGVFKKFDYMPADGVPQIDGVSIAEFDVVASDADNPAVKVISRGVRRETGVQPEVLEPSEYTGGHALFVGMSDADGAHLPGVTYGMCAFASGGGSAVIDARNDVGALFAARVFVDRYITGREPVPSDAELCGVGSNLLRKSGEESFDVSDGITYMELKYTDAHGLPVLAYLLKVERGADHLVMGMPGDGNEISGVSATVLEAMNSVEADGYDVAAGINGDFFHIESDYSPQGLCVKDGVILKNNTEFRPWIAVMKDGTFDCGNSGEGRSKIANMRDGFGASNVLYKNGLVSQDVQGSSFAEIRHPRTAMGYDSDGVLYLMVVDGRQPELSNGASLIDLTLMLMESGAECAVNLDGGGSSTMIIEENGGFEVKNSPCDGSLRKIFNSVVIVK